MLKIAAHLPPHRQPGTTRSPARFASGAQARARSAGQARQARSARIATLKAQIEKLEIRSKSRRATPRSSGRRDRRQARPVTSALQLPAPLRIHSRRQGARGRCLLLTRTQTALTQAASIKRKEQRADRRRRTRRYTHTSACACRYKSHRQLAARRGSNPPSTPGLQGSTTTTTKDHHLDHRSTTPPPSSSPPP